MPRQSAVKTLGSFGKKIKVYKAAMSLFEHLIQDPVYRVSFTTRARLGDLHPTLEKMMFEYLLGRPTENINLNVSDTREDLSQLTEDQLQNRVLQLQTQVQALSKKTNGESTEEMN